VLPEFKVDPLTSERWSDFEALFGPRGACGGCWCMTPRLSRAEYERNKGEGNRRAMRAIVDGGEVPGILGFLRNKAIAWCSLGPRERFYWLTRSRLFRQPVDEQPTWSIVCLFVDKGYRGQGVSVKMIKAACAFAASQGAQCVEAYPVEPRKSPIPPVFAFNGLASSFLRAGFQEVARRSETRPIMRYYIQRPNKRLQRIARSRRP
jgi:GNAT superfamily N-acetyltransferase